MCTKFKGKQQRRLCLLLHLRNLFLHLPGIARLVASLLPCVVSCACRLSVVLQRAMAGSRLPGNERQSTLSLRRFRNLCPSLWSFQVELVCHHLGVIDSPDFSPLSTLLFPILVELSSHLYHLRGFLTRGKRSKEGAT